MLSGQKPLAVFYDSLPSDPQMNVIPEKVFRQYVASGLFLKREQILSQGDRKVKYVLYAKPSDEWRIDAYLLLKKAAEKTGWNAGCEYMEGLLLGYQEWQMDLYIENISKDARPNADDSDSL